MSDFVVDKLTPEDLATLKKGLEFYDSQEVSLDNLNVVLQSLGITTSTTQFHQIKEELSLGVDSNGTVHFQKLLHTIDKILRDGFSLPEQDLLDAFKLFDKAGAGVIDSAILKPYLQSLGKLSEAEVDEMLEVADPTHTGKIKYYQFVKTLFQ